MGAGLRAARERAGYELDEVAEALRIRRLHLEAIEDGCYDDLPGPVYTVGFLRSYASFLGLDGEAVVRLFKDEARGFRTSTKLVFPEPPSEGKRPTATLVLVSMLVAGAIYGGWHYLSAKDRMQIAAVSVVPERLASTLAEPAPEVAVAGAQAATAADTSPEDDPEPAVGAPDEARSEVAAVALVIEEEAATLGELAPAAGPPPVGVAVESAETPPEPEPEASEPASRTVALARVDGPAPAADARASVVADPSPPAPVAEPTADAVAEAPPVRLATLPEPEAAPPPAILSAQEIAATSPGIALPAPARPSAPSDVTGGYVPQAYGVGNTEARVVLRALADAWVQIRGAGNELVLTRMLRAGDSYQVPDRDDLVMMTGNAGAIEITVDGKSIPPVGPMGAVMRDITLDADRLLERVALRE